jgi:hypothetical protein
VTDLDLTALSLTLLPLSLIAALVSLPFWGL